MFDFSTDTLIHYRHGNYWAIALIWKLNSFRLEITFGSLWDGYLNGIDSIGMSPDELYCGILAPSRLDKRNV